MNWKQTIVLGIIGGALVTLFTRVTVSVAPTPQTAKPASGFPDRPAFVAEVDRLRERLRTPVAPVRSARNPFRFSDAEPGFLTSAPPPETEPSQTSVGQRAVPSLQLIGIAQDAGPDGPVRTAIVVGPNGLEFAGVGDPVGPGYRVLTIRDDSVELVGAAPLSPLVLALK